MKRRTYYIVIRIHQCTDRPGSADGKIVASKIIRSRLGIFQMNEWREIVKQLVFELGYDLGSVFGYHDIREWNFITFVYGSFSSDGMGRSASSLWRIPTRKIIGKSL